MAPCTQRNFVSQARLTPASTLVISSIRTPANGSVEESTAAVAIQRRAKRREPLAATLGPASLANAAKNDAVVETIVASER